MGTAFERFDINADGPPGEFKWFWGCQKPLCLRNLPELDIFGHCIFRLSRFLSDMSQKGSQRLGLAESIVSCQHIWRFVWQEIYHWKSFLQPAALSFSRSSSEGMPILTVGLVIPLSDRARNIIFCRTSLVLCRGLTQFWHQHPQKTATWWKKVTPFGSCWGRQMSHLLSLFHKRPGWVASNDLFAAKLYRKLVPILPRTKILLQFLSQEHLGSYWCVA